jgi:hypothetical protein
MKKIAAILAIVTMLLIDLSHANVSEAVLGASWICGYNIANEALPHLWYLVRLGKI